MAGRGAPPQPERRRRAAPVRGEVQSATAVGWQHGKVPPPPDGLMPASVEAWTTWFAAWFASFWTPGDLPGLRVVVRLYDQVERGEYTRATELRLWSDTWGLSPKGRQDRRWRKPEASAAEAATTKDSAYRHLRAVEGEEN
jgi:hypothetical protein